MKMEKKTNNNISDVDQKVWPIPVHITADREDDFKINTRRCTKRFFINSVSVQQIAEYVNSKGPCVTNIRVFLVKRSKNRVILR